MSRNSFTKYYGEYSLEYWIKLLLKKDIILPNFQRPYVWKEKDIKSFLDSIEKKQFIPPVIIGKFVDKNENGENVEFNIILDGQQRLCSLIFAYYKIYPDSNQFKEIKNIRILDNEDDNNNEMDENKNDSNKSNENDEDNANNATSILSYIQKKFYDGNYNNAYGSIDEFNDIITNDKNFKKIANNYIPSECKKNIKDFFEDNYIPFIYVKPSQETININNEKEYYSNLFYNINKKGVELNNQECRNAIVWLSNKKWQTFFNKFKFKIYIRGKEVDPVDFSYYLSILVFIEYKSDKKVENIKDIINELFVKRYRKEEREDFILDFLKTINEHNNVDNETFGRPNDMLNDVFLANESKLLTLVEKYIVNKEYTTIAHFEIEFIGLMYWTLFKGKDIDLCLYENKIKEKIEILEGKDKDKYRRNINNQKNLRERIIASIDIYK